MRPSSRLRRWLLVTSIALVIFALVGFFALPPIVRAQLEKRASAELGRTVTVERVRLNPFALSLTLEKFAVREKEGPATFIRWDRLYVNFEAFASFTGDWVLGAVELDGFQAAIAIDPQGVFNFSDLLTRFAVPTAARPPEKTAALRPLRVRRLNVAQARVNFSDGSRPHPFVTVVGPLTFTLTEFRTVGERGAPYHFTATTESGEKLMWTGTLAADPVSSRGEFAVENLVLKKYAPYFESQFRGDVAAGMLTVRGRYDVNLAAKARALKVMGTELHLRDLRINESAGGPVVVDLPSLDVVGVEADGVALKASVARVALAGGHIAVRREKDGSVNLLALLAPAPPAAAPGASGLPASAPAVPAKLPEITIAEVALSDFKIDLTDLAAPRPAQLGLSGLQLSLKNITLSDGAVVPLALSFDWAPHGKVQVAGNVTLKPALTADLKADVTGFEVLPLSPYLEEFVNARVTQGTVSTASNLRVDLAGGAPAITLSGGLSVERLGLVDGARSEELAGFTSLALTGLKVATAPRLAVSVDELNLASPYARVVVNADKSINLVALAKTSDVPVVEPAVSSTTKPGVQTPSTDAAPLPSAPGPKIEIARVVVSGGDFSFSDGSVAPQLRVALNQFGGTVTGLSSENLARGEVDLRGMVDGAGPVVIVGKLDPLGASKFVDLKLDFKNVDLVPLSPYVGKFAGYELARGKLVVDAKFLLDGKKIVATNVVTLNQFTFGAATASPEATKLPVRLGVALLKDTDGKIVIDLPVEGSLDDPSFRIGRVVLRVVVNLLTKAAASPFALVGSMFGGGGDELAFQEFAPGASILLATEAAKLDTLLKALTNRPALSLGLEGGYDTAPDTYALKQQKLADRIRRQIWETRRAADPGIAPPEQLTIAPEEHAAMVKKLFDATFPPGTQFGAPLPPPPAVAAPPPAPPVGFFQRLVNTVTGRDRWEARAAQAANERRAAEHEKAPVPEAAAGLPLAEMTARLAETMEVTADDLRALAAARAQRVRDRLVEGGIAADRLFLTQAKEAANESKGPRVFLSLQ